MICVGRGSAVETTAGRQSSPHWRSAGHWRAATRRGWSRPRSPSTAWPKSTRGCRCAAERLPMALCGRHCLQARPTERDSSSRSGSAAPLNHHHQHHHLHVIISRNYNPIQIQEHCTQYCEAPTASHEKQHTLNVNVNREFI